MNNNSKAKLCYKGICAEFYGRNAEVINTIGIVTVSVLAALTLMKALNK
jgi:hypothetical protein